MKPIPLIAALAIAATPALAGPPGGCPPGLAKKEPACVPPGLAKKGVDREEFEARRDVDDDVDYEIGEEIVDFDDLVLIRDPGRYGLDPYGTYYRAGEEVIRVDRETQEVIAMIGLARAVLEGER